MGKKKKAKKEEKLTLQEEQKKCKHAWYLKMENYTGDQLRECEHCGAERPFYTPRKDED